MVEIKLRNKKMQYDFVRETTKVDVKRFLVKQLLAFNEQSQEWNYLFKMFDS